MRNRAVLSVGLALLLASCNEQVGISGQSASTTTTVPQISTTPPASTTTEVVRELMIVGTGEVYTLEGSQAFGEFGPLLWNLVTTLNGTDDIEHGLGYEWVAWGPLWGGRLRGTYEFPKVYGVTDLDAIDAEAMAAAVPAETVIVLREVPWSLDELEDYETQLRTLMVENQALGICAWELRDGEEGIHVTATLAQIEMLRIEIPRMGMPVEAFSFEPASQCPYGVYWGETPGDYPFD
jgi:hypothetical protein